MANNVTEAIDEITASYYSTFYPNHEGTGKSANAVEAIDKFTEALGGTGGRSENLVEAITKLGPILIETIDLNQTVGVDPVNP